SRRGIGWELKTENASCGDLFSDASYGHTGFTGTSLWIDPREELFVVFLTNRVHPSRENRKILRIRPLLHNIIASSIKD
ncbi:MAG: serine hydrolase, partial [Thermoprotei archaeon]